MSAKQATAIRVFETDRVIVTRWVFRPGEATGFHTHRYDYVVVPISSGLLRIVEADGTAKEAQLHAGEPYSRKAGVAHDVVNENSFEFTFVEIELK
jgi:quercetin dioxygenase-like cupin family protein